MSIDVGTETDFIRNDPYYIGLKQKRVRGQNYDDLLSEFIEACHSAYGRNVLIQVSVSIYISILCLYVISINTVLICICMYF